MIDTKPIINISVFGSYGRGNQDRSSDLDVLVVCPDNGGTQSEEYVRATISSQYAVEPSISWYGKNKIRHYFATGDLFAWHLFHESFPLPGFRHLRDIFGMPEPYTNCLDDVAGLVEILKSIPNQIQSHPQNLIYELGIAYVCLRNIAMTASSILLDKPDFGRNSPYSFNNSALPISEENYKTLASCRHASTRGTEVPSISMDLYETLEVSISWAQSVERICNEKIT
jgi:predicted nucleotidyltransferase